MKMLEESIINIPVRSAQVLAGTPGLTWTSGGALSCVHTHLTTLPCVCPSRVVLCHLPTSRPPYASFSV